MEDETAGDPMSGVKWTRRTTEKISEQLKTIGVNVSRNTVGRLLKKLDFSLKVNHKKLSKGTKTTRATRDQQFTVLGEPPTLREIRPERRSPREAMDFVVEYLCRKLTDC